MSNLICERCGKDAVDLLLAVGNYREYIHKQIRHRAADGAMERIILDKCPLDTPYYPIRYQTIKKENSPPRIETVEVEKEGIAVGSEENAS